MARGKVSLAFFFALIVSSALAACGLYTPDKDPFTSNAPDPSYTLSRQGSYESALVDHVTCEITQGLVEATRAGGLKWLPTWGTAVTLTLTVEDQTGLSPGVSLITPLPNRVFPFPTGGNVTSPQSFSLSIGGTASVNALRTETIQYTIKNSDLLDHPLCYPYGEGVLIDGDLKIREFIFDKAAVAATANGAWSLGRPPYNTWTEEITFVSAYGGTVTPTWKLARLSAGASSNLVVGQRTNTNDLVITLGPLDPCQNPATSRKRDDPKSPPKCPPEPVNAPIQLTAAAMNQHNARVQANAIAVSLTGQTH
jgi:hypothetical protein